MCSQRGLHMLLDSRSLHKLVAWKWKACVHGGVCACWWRDVICRVARG